MSVSDIRLSGRHSGRVEIYQSGVWGTICDDDFDDLDARVICRSINTSYIDAEARTDAYFGAGAGDILQTELWCSGVEDNVYSCPRRDQSSQWICSHGEDAGVICYEGTLDEYTMCLTSR